MNMVHRNTVEATYMQPGLVPEVLTVADVMLALWYEGLAGFTRSGRVDPRTRVMSQHAR